MAHIRYVPLAEQRPQDRVPDSDHIIQVHSVHPAVMRLHHDLYQALLHAPGPLSRREREMIAVRVSGLNHCPYCIAHHGGGLRELLASDGLDAAEQDELIHALTEWPIEALPVTPREAALLRYVDRVTLAPARLTAADVVPLREAGLDDRAIHDACAIAAYAAFVNRIADGLGVEVEERHRQA